MAWTLRLLYRVLCADEQWIWNLLRHGTEVKLADFLVSVVLTTRDRPRLLPVALACYHGQAYQPRELIVVDDGSQFPASVAEVEAAGGRLIRAKPGIPLGVKLNLGASVAHGRLCMKMDDDDWYAPNYLETMVAAWQADRQHFCRPVLVFLYGFLFFDLFRWEIRQTRASTVPGASLLFGREDWAQRPFRPLPTDEDQWFIRDQGRIGRGVVPVQEKEIFLAIRHYGHAQTRGHTWTHQLCGQRLDDQIQEYPLYPRKPEELLPDWALSVYRDLHRDLIRSAADAVARAGPSPSHEPA